MTDRRPHWTDDLIDAVFRALSATYVAQGWQGGIAIDLDESVYPLIAAVEDWQDDNGLGRIGQLLGERQSAINERIDAEAAIQQVRGALDDALMGVAVRGTGFADFVDQVADIVTAMGESPVQASEELALAKAAIRRVRELHRHRMGSRYYVCAECGDNVSYPCATRRLVDDDPWAFLRALDRPTPEQAADELTRLTEEMGLYE